MSDLAEDIRAGIKSVSAEWKRAKKTSDKHDRVSRPRMAYMRRYHFHETTIKDAAFEVMEQAYNHASSNGKYYANARQIMYAARPGIINMIPEGKWNNEASPKYFQELLKDYMEGPGYGFKVVWDARGHLKEPHTEHEIGLGGADVSNYLGARLFGDVEEIAPIQYDRVKTKGAHNRIRRRALRREGGL